MNRCMKRTVDIKLIFSSFQTQLGHIIIHKLVQVPTTFLHRLSRSTGVYSLQRPRCFTCVKVSVDVKLQVLPTALGIFAIGECSRCACWKVGIDV